MIIEKLKLINFKKFYGEKNINFNDDFNIIIGDNETGKSSILLALDLVLSGSQNKIETIGLENPRVLQLSNKKSLFFSENKLFLMFKM